jgi:hypothetical protein
MLLGLVVYGLLAGGPQSVRAAWSPFPSGGEAREEAGSKSVSEESATALVRSREHRALPGLRRTPRLPHFKARVSAGQGPFGPRCPGPSRRDLNPHNGIGGPLRC